jgi:hypothetical protein
MVPELDVGQLVKDPYLTLFESVGALEVSLKYSIHLSEIDFGRLWIRKWTVATWNLER